MSTTQINVRSEGSLAGFEAGESAQAGALALMAREDTEFKAAIVAAKHFPRDEAAAYAKLMKSCDRPTLAEDAAYSFPRGGAEVSGPSVYLAREAARCWGNIRSGLRIVSVDADQVHIRGYAIDCETNTYAESEDRFAKKIQRKVNGRTAWVDPDERDLRELMNRRGAICERNAILRIIPSDVIEDALRRANKTLKAAANGELEQSREDAVRRIVLAFDRFGVTAAMLVEHIGHELSLITPDELATLRGVYKSIDDGNTRPADHFKPAPSRESATESPAGDLNDRIKQKAAQESTSPVSPDSSKNEEATRRLGMARQVFEQALIQHRPDLVNNPDALSEFLSAAIGAGDIAEFGVSEFNEATKAVAKPKAETAAADATPASAEKPKQESASAKRAPATSPLFEGDE